MVEFDEQTLRRRLVKWRETRGLSQLQLHKLSGVSQAHISYIENGLYSPTIDKLIKLAKGLNVSLQDLLFTDPDQVDVRVHDAS